MADHSEEREFVIRLEAKRSFSPAYDGEADGFEWAEREFAPMNAAVVSAVVQVLRQYEGWSIRPRNRGVPSDAEVTLVLEKRE